jgi:hypothetical protein
MANKTLYVRESDLPLWDLAQVHLGQSISGLFSEFLRERVKMMNVFVHVLRSAPHSQDLAVMFSPAGPTGAGGPGSPQYVQEPKLVETLKRSGIASSVAAKIASDLKSAQSVSELTTVTRRRSAMSERFQAGVQYGDWKGTAAADQFGDVTDKFDEVFEATGKVDPEKEIMIGFEFYYSEGMFQCSGYFHPVPEENDGGYYPTLDAKFQKDRVNPIQVKKVDVELTLEEFFKYFKRFNVVLVNGAMDIIGSEYEVTDAM